MAPDPYSTLGVARGASAKEVKTAYRKLAKQLHPDTNPGNAKAAARFAEVTGAYDLLSDDAKRAQFNRGEIDADGNPAYPQGFGQRGPGGGFNPQQGFGGGEADLGGIFEGLFGGRGGAGFGARAAPRGANRAYRLAVPLPDAARLAPQRITLADGKTIDLKLPAGLEDGTQMRLGGKGEAGPGGAGDALITIAISPHPFFSRDGDNVRVTLPVTLDEAISGGKLRVPTADGAVMLNIAPMSSSGRILRLKGKGFTRKDGSRGDQLVSLEIVLPELASEAGADLIARTAGWRDGRDPRARLAD